MKKFYELYDGTWIWDTETERWTAPRTSKPPVTGNNARAAFSTHEDPSDNRVMDWRSILHWLFVEHRASPGWDLIRAPFESDDMKVIERLETYYQAGKLTVKGVKNVKNAA